MDVFEYKTTNLETGKSISAFSSLTEKELNNLGKDGWELVSTITLPYLGSSQYALIGVTQKIVLVSKRRLEQDCEDKI